MTAAQAHRSAYGDHPVSRGEPRVSVVMIFLDAARFIEESIESVLSQTYDRWELLLVDDGSADGSAEIARSYAKEHQGRIRYITHPGGENRGMSASRNLGIRHARGEFIALLDADDVFLPEKLERQVALLDTHPEVGMVYGATEYWYSWTGRPEDRRRDRPRRIGVRTGRVHTPPAILYRVLRNEARTPCTCGVLLRREVAELVGGFEEEFKGMYEDQVFFIKVLRHVPVYVSAECLDRYRQHPASHVHQSRARKSRGEVNPGAVSDRWLQAYLDRPDTRHPALARALRRQAHPLARVAYRFGIGLAERLCSLSLR
jgi:glycosyltransferase involved in cell wall biosynthesis